VKRRRCELDTLGEAIAAAIEVVQRNGPRNVDVNYLIKA
jgi:hypothetical protein